MKDQREWKKLQSKLKAGLKRALQRLKEVKRKEEGIGEFLRKSIISELEKFLSA